MLYEEVGLKAADLSGQGQDYRMRAGLRRTGKPATSSYAIALSEATATYEFPMLCSMRGTVGRSGC
ncbi:hypothetical protein MES4922_20169 [Mesorhizobium ventifaucium]|uniref:Uncharacterized protein n=1 Tax=Mesorhizobium ventifaucium TaxID=666020 RepID=A0ABN8JK99_9HYPH|nr:hypothetical protein MES4922_20169 [Mesorhizobium ventifaucium]